MITLSDIQSARERIAPYIFRTPLIHLEGLNEKLGFDVYIKAECMQKTNSFKIRGALNKMLSLPKEDLEKGVVAASSGNHGKGVAFAAKMLGVKATIVLPDTAPEIKVQGIKDLQAEVVQCKLAERHEKATQLSRDHGYTVIHPYDDYAIMAGQGTAGLEILEQLPDVDYVVVPIGGGGLISGIATAIKSVNPNVKVIGAEPANAARYTASRAKGERTQIEEIKSLADALLTLIPGEKNFPIVQTYVDDIFTVNEESLLLGEKTLLLEGKVLAEPSSSIGIGGTLQGTFKAPPGSKVCFLVSGGNVALSQISQL